MSDPYIGEIRLVGMNFAPQGWAFCDGQLLSIAENDALFSLLGTTYGGDGQTTFGLPDLRGRVPVHQGHGPSGTTYVLGELLGAEQVTLGTSQLPSHSHQMRGAAGPETRNTVGGVLAAGGYYADATPDTPLHPNSLGAAGGSSPVSILQPVLALNFIIALFGIYPSQ